MKNFTPTKAKANYITYWLCFTFLIISELGIAQTVNNIFPNRVTRRSVITIIGTGFDETVRDNISLGTLVISERKLISPTEMSFEIADLGTSDVTQNVTVGSIDLSGINNSIDYIAPKKEVLSNNNNRNTVTRISEIFTDYNGFWRTSYWRNSSDPGPDALNNPFMPNTRHHLLGFTVNGVTYSTGVNDAVLTANGITNFTAQTYKAYSTAGISGKTHKSNRLMLAELLDGIPEGLPETNGNITTEINDMKVYDVFIDGINGLDIGTGATQFNQTANVRFFSGNGQVGAVNDGIPDLLITQIGATQNDKSNIYFYADVDGNVVGTPIELEIRKENDNAGPSLLGRWRIDFYDFPNNVDYDVATPYRRTYNDIKTRRLRMVGFELEDFDINAGNITNVNNLNSVAGGTADIAFLAYNRNAFEIKSPVISDYPNSRYICKFPFNDAINFEVQAEIDGGPSGTGGLPTSDEEISYQWYRNNTIIPGATSNTYTVNSPTPVDVGLYKVRVSNTFGTSIVPVNILEGGIPSTWNGTSWQYPSSYDGIAVEDGQRNLIFPENFTVSGALEGCDCVVPAGSQVTVASGSTLRLHRTITVEPEEPDGIDPNTGQIEPGEPAGVFILEDNANLVQIDPTTVNLNTGTIRMQREASNLHEDDYVYWSSPVQDFNVSGISNTQTYVWDVNVSNSNGTEGNWVSASGSIMTLGKGYIVQVPSAATFTTNFVGVPNNGEISIQVNKTSITQAADNRHWNLIGNPYPSSINATKFLAENTRLDGFVRIWMHNSAISSTPNSGDSPFYNNFAYNYGDQYLTSNGTGATPFGSFNGNIAAGQGFFVQVRDNANAGAVNFKNRMRYQYFANTDSYQGYDNTNFYRFGSEDENSSEEDTTTEKQLIWLSLVNESDLSTSTLVGYVDGATNERDRLFDAIGGTQDFGIYSLIGSEGMIIQGRSLPFDTSDIVPLGISIQENGIYSIVIDNLEGSLFTDQIQEIFLEDMYLNEVHNLRETPYSFTTEAGAISDRFVLRYNSDEALSVNNRSTSETFAYIYNNVLNIASSQGIEEVVVNDLTGKVLANYSVKGYGNNFNTAFNFSRSIYLISIKLDSGVIVTKKLIN